jgi:hypothetical protein
MGMGLFGIEGRQSKIGISEEYNVVTFSVLDLQMTEDATFTIVFL